MTDSVSRIQIVVHGGAELFAPAVKFARSAVPPLIWPVRVLLQKAQIVKRRINAAQAGARLLQLLTRIVERAAVMADSMKKRMASYP